MSQELSAAVVSLETLIPRSLRKCWHLPPTPVGITWGSNTLFSRSFSFRLRKCWTTFQQRQVRQEEIRQLWCFISEVSEAWAWLFHQRSLGSTCHTGKVKRQVMLEHLCSVGQGTCHRIWAKSLQMDYILPDTHWLKNTAAPLGTQALQVWNGVQKVQHWVQDSCVTLLMLDMGRAFPKH